MPPHQVSPLRSPLPYHQPPKVHTILDMIDSHECLPLPPQGSLTQVIRSDVGSYNGGYSWPWTLLKLERYNFIAVPPTTAAGAPDLRPKEPEAVIWQVTGWEAVDTMRRYIRWVVQCR